MLVITIKDLKMYLNNSNLLTGKNAICFELLAQKEETDKQIASTLYYKYYKSVSQEYMLVLGKLGPKPPLPC